MQDPPLRAGCGRSVVDGEGVHSGLAVGVAGEAVAAGGLEAGVAGEFGDEHDVVAGADELGQAGVSEGVCGRFEVGVLGEPADGEVDRPAGEPLAFEREQQGGAVAAGQAGASVEPGVEGVAGVRVERDLAVAVALAAADGDEALAGADGDITEVEGGELADPQAGEQQQRDDCPVPYAAGGAGLGGAFGGPQESAGLLDGQGAGAACGRSSRRTRAGPSPIQR